MKRERKVLEAVLFAGRVMGRVNKVSELEDCTEVFIEVGNINYQVVIERETGEYSLYTKFGLDSDRKTAKTLLETQNSLFHSLVSQKLEELSVGSIEVETPEGKEIRLEGGLAVGFTKEGTVSINILGVSLREVLALQAEVRDSLEGEMIRVVGKEQWEGVVNKYGKEWAFSFFSDQLLNFS